MTDDRHEQDRLDAYRAKRDFARTPEPGPQPVAKGDRMRFVIQEHHARRLHWDFRLERNGVLVSWALPRGLPRDPARNHLAIHTEDHPLSYIDFAGEIPAGNYGAGQVSIWDRGTYECHKFEDDKVVVTLHGRRARGKFALFQTDGKDWMVHRMDAPEPDHEPMPERIVPMAAKLASLPRDDDRWAYEIKWDGVRAIAYVEDGRVRLESRNLLDITAQYPEIRALGVQLGSRNCVLDGEIIAPDAQGRPSFERLQGRMGVTGEAAVRRKQQDIPVVYMIFDLLYFEGSTLMPLPYEQRRAGLDALGLAGPAWQTPRCHAGDGGAFREASRQQGLEGIVAKRLDSPYVPGARPGTWLKIKNLLRQEFVIGGYSPGERHPIGSLMLGYYDVTEAAAKRRGNPQRLLYAGSVGTGFTQTTLDKLAQQLQPLRRLDNPFATRPPKPDAVFVAPQRVCEVEFREWTQGGLLRGPSFKGLREDKNPREVLRETL